MSEQIKELKSKLSGANNEIKLLQKIVKSLQRDLEKSQKATNIAEAKHADIEAENGQNVDLYNVLKKEDEMTRRALSKLQGEFEEMEKLFKGALKVQKEVIEENDKLLKDIKYWKECTDGNANDYIKLKKDYDERLVEIKELKTENEKCPKEVNIDIEKLINGIHIHRVNIKDKPAKLVSVNLMALCKACGVEDPADMTMVEAGKVERSMRHLFEQTKAYGE